MLRSRHLPSQNRMSLLGFCLFVFAATLVAQSSGIWEAVPKADLELKDNPSRAGDAAMILERRIYTDDEKRVETEWFRIKVLTERGRSYADIEIPYLAKNTFIEDIRARTVRADGTEIPFSGAVFDKSVLKYKKYRYNAKVFSLPGVDVGSVIEYSYTMRWKERLPDYVLNPGNYTISPLQAWTIPTTTWVVQQRLFTRHAVFLLRPVKHGVIGFAKVRLPRESPSQQQDGTIRMEVSNVPPIEQEEYMPPESLLNSRVHFYYRIGYYFDYWVAYGRMKEEDAAKFLEKARYLERAANEIAPPSDPSETRLRKLYARVQKIRDLSAERRTEKELQREDLDENKNAEDILRHGYGYGNQTNFLFTALARAAGFDASIVEVVDRSSARFEPDVLDGSQLNAMVVLVKLNGNNLYFDPASRFCPYGMLPWFESDTRGVRWSKLGGEVVTVKAQEDQTSSVERTADLKLQSDGTLDGTLEIVFSGQEALDWRLLLADEDEPGRLKLLENDVMELVPQGTTIKVDSVTGWQDAGPLRISAHLSAPQFAVMAKDRLIFPFSVLQGNNRTRLHHLNRVQAVYFRHGYSTLDKISIALPVEYQVEAIPTDANIKTAFSEFHAERMSQAHSVRLRRASVMRGYYFPVETYGILREYLENVRQSDVQNVILHRVESVQAH